MAVLQGGVLNLACLFPPIYIQGFVVGAGLSGVGTSVLSFITQLRATEVDAGLGIAARRALLSLDGLLAGSGHSGSGHSGSGGHSGGDDSGGGSGGARTAAEVAPAAFAYFSAAASVTALCVVAFTLLGRLDFSRARLFAHYAAGGAPGPEFHVAVRTSAAPLNVCKILYT
jgi:hypothetical protein